MKVKNKSFIVTGGGNGIGREIVLLLLKKGARIAVVDIDEAGLKVTTDRAGGYQDKLSNHIVDITDREAVLMLPEVVIQAHGNIDGIINNAGIIHRFVRINDKDYLLSLELTPAKSSVWHCDDGVLKMGVDDPKEMTYYWSYTNLASSGKLVLGNKDYIVSGKAWFDKQGGTYTLTSRWTNWEWFSLRFFDGEEVMLFSFPQDNYRDGTYIEKSGNYKRLDDYRITLLGFTEAGGKKFSCGWKVEIKNIKDMEYKIIPKIDGQLNLFYFELLADIIDKRGKHVGYCVVELLPGVYNEISAGAAFARVK